MQGLHHMGLFHKHTLLETDGNMTCRAQHAIYEAH